MPHNPSLLPDLPCYLNGDYTVLSLAKVSVMDRGFIFGDGIYEVVPAYSGQPFRFDEHFARLERSLSELRIANPLSKTQWRDMVTELISKLIATSPINALANTENSGFSEPAQLVYIQVTRGVAMRDHVMVQGVTPTVFAFANTMKPPTPEQRQHGVSCVSADDFRWAKAHLKSTSLLGAVMSRQISADVGALETVMFRGDTLSEAAASNVWVVKNGRVIGPKKNNLVLEGIRYGLFEQICQQEGIGFELRDISRAEVLDADELLLSSATKEVLAITQLDAQPVGSGKPGPVCARLYAAYQRTKQASRPAQSASSSPQAGPNAAAPTDTLLEFPCDFPLKVAGANSAEFVAAMNHIAAQFDPQFNPDSTTLRQSAKGSYLAATLHIHATSKAQLDELYRTLSTHPLVKWAM